MLTDRIKKYRSFVSDPEPDQEAFSLRLGGVLEDRPGMAEHEIVDELHLTALQSVLAPQLRAGGRFF